MLMSVQHLACAILVCKQLTPFWEWSKNIVWVCMERSHTYHSREYSASTEQAPALPEVI